jgi:eukaryotic-like serine/threonine-protein kinase
MSLPDGTRIGRYVVRSLLGAGGMGEVYLADDSQLRRKVALKLLPERFAADRDRLNRFRHEALAASSLNHPNILTIFEIGSESNHHFIATEFVDGESLRRYVERTSLELREILDISIQIVSALAASHAAGVVHRDIKPENIMVRPDGYMKVLDFGLAKLTEPQSGNLDLEAETIQGVKTQPGIVMGTVTYMSPEQARGLEVDARSDIWSIGVVMYEMVARNAPFGGLTQNDVVASILMTEPPALSRFSPNVPSELQRIVRKTLRKNKEERYSTVKELLIDLHNLQRDLDSKSRTEIVVEEEELKSVAILPFKNVMNDSSVSFYEFSLADAVITELVRLRSLIVRPSSAIARYIGQTKDPLEAARELKVNAVLAASFLHSAARIRVTVQLLDAATGRVLWGDRIDSDADDIITLQDIIAQRIVEGLQLKLTSEEHVDLAGHATMNAAAYEEYLRGRDRVGKYIYHTVANEDIEAAIAHFKRAIELDSKFALAHCALGGCHIQRILKTTGKAEDLVLARNAFERGLALDPEIREAQVYMVFVYRTQGETRKARTEMANLRREAPNNASVQFVSGVFHRLDGEYEKALQSFDAAQRLNPAETVVISWSRARIFMYQGRYDEAQAELDRGAAIEPNHPVLKTFQGQLLTVRGDLDAAAALFQKVLLEHPNIEAIRPLYAQCLSARGEHKAARAQLTDRVKELALLDHDVPYWLASAYAEEREDDEAFKWLRMAITLGNENLPWFRSNPAWQSLRADERFETLMQEIERRREKRVASEG